MTKVIIVAELGRAFPPRHQSCLVALRRMFPDGRLHLDETGLISLPAIKSPAELQPLEACRQGNITGFPRLSRLGRCNWLDGMNAAPLTGDVETARDWLSRAVDQINRGLQTYGRPD